MAISKLLINHDTRFKKCEFIVEANRYERLALWKEWHVAISWEEDCKGLIIEIGKLAGRPILLNFSFALINRHLVAFYDSPSQVVDHKQIDEFLRKNFQVTYDAGRWAHCDAMNFSHCLSYIVDKVKDEVVYKKMIAIKELISGHEKNIEIMLDKIKEKE
jgi:hypothetical protein